jgi:hypothetical protein
MKRNHVLYWKRVDQTNKHSKCEFTLIQVENKLKQETFIIASDQIKAHFPNTIVKNTDFH